MNNEKVLSFAIDLGAKNTGVFSAYYRKGSKLSEITAKKGIVYNIEKDKYTLLMTNRTAKRHQRRGLDRNQLAKRLFKLIWEKALNQTWNDEIQQMISFLLNRRGFSFLEEQHDSTLFLEFPTDGLVELPTLLRIDTSTEDYYDLNKKILESLENDTFSQIYNEIANKIKEVKNQLVKAKTINLIKEAIDVKVSTGEFNPNSKDKFNELEKVSLWIVEEIFSRETLGVMEQSNNYSRNILTYLKNLSNEHLDKIKQDLPTINIEGYKNSVWNFNIVNFNLDNQKIIAKLKSGDVQTHLQHLAFALNNIKKELDGGSRHRSKYFEEIKEVLNNDNHIELYLKTFVKNLKSNKFDGLDARKLTNIIGNISNLELKPLRKYFNDISYAKVDEWNEKKFAEIFCRWILSEWRVGSKDKDKQDGKKYSYRELCEEIKTKVGSTREIQQNHMKGSLIDLLKNLEPCRTIPPYQDNNNRNPPKCQSLILNAKLLEEKYPNWQKYLDALTKLDSIQTYLDNFKDELKNLTSGKQKKYFVANKNDTLLIASGQRDFKDLDARVLQLIFDRVKVTDDLLLNEIYSLAKKIKQSASTLKEKQEYTQKLNGAILKSKLPVELKSQHNAGIFDNHSFLHLVCKYYKYRQRAKDSRLFIMPEYKYDNKLNKWNNTDRFDDRNQLITYCNHKPRQKRYQLINDLAGVLQISPKLLIEKVGSEDDDKIIEWTKQFKIGSYCAQAVEVQQHYRGTLAQEIRSIKFKSKIEAINKNKKSSDEEKLLLERYPSTKAPNSEERNLLKLVKNIDKSSQKIGEILSLSENQITKFNSIFSYAQIEQIAFKERNGNASTCAVCSFDNAFRMQDSGISTKAQRLPAIATRIIDGAIKKMATIISRKIVEDNWNFIKESLLDNQKIHIPIITESNAFEFEPNLADLKGRKLKEKRAKSLDTFNPQIQINSKNNRIKLASMGISAYSGISLNDPVEYDHIIPRSSKKYGTLNDEANLICVSRDDNQKRVNTPYYLSNLANNFKLNQFNTTNNQEIEDWITATIWDNNKKSFKFGEYRSFINLNDDEQRAFRYALFLADHNELKQAVIRAINNRNRTFVNGTQRYFAEILANSIYLRAKKEKLPLDNISFDYFGIETLNGIYDLRKFYENHDYANILQYSKQANTTQKEYSHLIDAMLAFCIGADKHKNEGSIGLVFEEEDSLYPVNLETGEVYQKDIFSQIKINDNGFEATALSRRKATDQFNTHRQMTRDGIYAEHYLPILIHKKQNEVRKGFTWTNSEEVQLFKGKNLNLQQINNILFILQFINKPIIYKTEINTLEDLRLVLEENTLSSNDEYFYINLKTQQIHEYYIENYNTALGYQKYTPEMDFVRSLSYRTEKITIKSIDDVKNNLDKDTNFTVGKVVLPCKKEWQILQKLWLSSSSNNKEEFLKSYFKVINTSNNHIKVRKDYSLPIKSLQGKYLFKRKSWDNSYIYQILNNADPRTDDVQAFVPVFDKRNNQRGKGIINIFNSKNIFMLSNDEFLKINHSDIIIIDSSKWFDIEVPDELKHFKVITIHFRVDNNTRPWIKLHYQNILKENIELLLSNNLLKPNVVNDLKAQLENQYSCNSFIYKGAGFSSTVELALNNALNLHYEASNN